MRIVLDTNVLYDRAAVMSISDDPRPKILPAVAFAERARQRQRDFDEPPAQLRAWLDDLRIHVEDFGPVQAERIAARVGDERVWARHARDAMIAGHVEEMDELWTANARDFVAVGVDPRHIVDITGPSIESVFMRHDL